MGPNPMMRNRKPADMNRRRFLKKAVFGTGVAIGAIEGGITIARGVRRFQAQKMADLAARQKVFQAKGIANPSKWARLSGIYKLDPIANAADANFVSRINRISGTVNLEPETVLSTIEQNTISARQLQALKDSMAKQGLSAGEIQRRQRISGVIRELLKIPDAEREAILRKISGTRGSAAAVRRMANEK